MERSNGEERTESKCRKDKDHDLWYGTGPPAEFRRVSMCRVSHWSGQQQHLLQWLQARVHKKCSGPKRLKKDPDYRCTRCQGTACPLDGRPQKEVQIRPDKLEVVASFCYLGDMLSAAGSCELSTTTRVRKPPGRSSKICYQFSLHTTSVSKHVAVCTALVCRAQCSMPARLGH